MCVCVHRRAHLRRLTAEYNQCTCSTEGAGSVFAVFLLFTGSCCVLNAPRRTGLLSNQGWAEFWFQADPLLSHFYPKFNHYTRDDNTDSWTECKTWADLKLLCVNLAIKMSLETNKKKKRKILISRAQYRYFSGVLIRYAQYHYQTIFIYIWSR